MFRFTLTHVTEGTEVLTRDPEGWPAISVRHERNKRYHGFFQAFTQTLGFKCNGGGKEFIDRVYQLENVDGEIGLLIEYEETNNPGTFDTIFDGIVNMRSYTLTDLGGLELTEVNIEDQGIARQVLTRDELDIDLEASVSIDGDAIGGSYTYGLYDLNVCGQMLQFVTHYKETTTPVSYSNDSFNAIPASTEFITSLTRTAFIQHPWPSILAEIMQSTEPHLDGIEVINGGIQSSILTLPCIDTVGQPLLSLPGNIVVDYDFGGDYSDTILTGAQTRSVSNVCLVVAWGPTVAGIVSANSQQLGCIAGAGYTTSAGTFNDTFTFAGSFIISSLQPGDKIWIYWVASNYLVTTGGGGVSHNIRFGFDYDTADIKFTYNSIREAKDSKAWGVHETFGRILAGVTNNPDPLKSEFFGRLNSEPRTYSENGCGSFTAITNGLSIRGFNNDSYDKPVATSLRDLYRSMDAVWSIGLGIESGEVVIEGKQYFYDDTLLTYRFGALRAEVKIDETRYFNKIYVGFERWKPNEVNGLDEFNGWQEYAINHKNLKGEVNLRSKFVGSGYAIEVTRRLDSDLYGTTDGQFDDNFFVICLKRGVDGNDNPNELDEPEGNNEAFVNVVNQISADLGLDCIYNLRISPKRSLLRHLNILSAGLFFAPGKEYQFQKGEGNVIMQGEDQTATFYGENCPGDFYEQLLTENQDLAFDAANIRRPVPIFVPEIYKFTVPLSYCDYKDVITKLRGVVEFTHLGIEKAGFILSLDYSIQKGNATFELLRKYDGDLTPTPPPPDGPVEPENPETDDIEIWLDAAVGYIVKDGADLVETWTDRSGNGRDHSQNVGANKPLWVGGVLGASLRPIVRFNNDWLDMVAQYVPVPGDWTLYYICQVTGLNGTGGQTLCATDSGSGLSQFFLGPLDSNVLATGQPFEVENNGARIRARNDANFNGMFATLTHQEDLILKDNVNGGYSNTDLIDDQKFERLGNRTWNTAFYFVGDVGEFILYSVRHSPVQKTNVYNYFAAKFA